LVPDYETRAAERFTRCLENLVEAHPEPTLAVVSHGLVITLFLARLENRWPTVAEWRAVPFTGLAVIDTTSSPWRLIKGWSRVSETV